MGCKSERMIRTEKEQEKEKHPIANERFGASGESVKTALKEMINTNYMPKSTQNIFCNILIINDLQNNK